MLIAAVLMSTSVVCAQNGERNNDGRKIDRMEMVKKRTERMARELNLSEEQTRKLQELNVEYADKMPQMGRRPGGRGMGPGGMLRHRADSTQQQPERAGKEEMAARMQKMRAAREAYNAELRKIMTEEQFGKYVEAQKRRMQRRGMGARRGNGMKMRETSAGQD